MAVTSTRTYSDPRFEQVPRPELPASLRVKGPFHRSDSPLASLVASLLGDDLPVGFRTYDGGYLGPERPGAVVEVRSSDALRRLVTAPGELGFARAYVAGDIEITGDIFDVLDLREVMPSPRLTPSTWVKVLRVVGPYALRPLEAPPEELKPSGRMHSLRRDRRSVSHHYDVSNEFYETVLGPAMTYSCALFNEPDYTLEQAQWSKLELVSTKLGLRPGMRLLDVGCGWGSMVRHAARHHGVHAVGVTISAEQAAWAREAVEREGLSERVEIRLADYRELGAERFDAISSIGMSEHVGDTDQLAVYFATLHRLLDRGGRLLNHAISRPPGSTSTIGPRSFVGRYVFPDGALVEVGRAISAMQEAGFEVRHMENLREHYARTLRSWVANLEANWDECVVQVGEPRARIWRLYMAGSALGFEDARIAVNQILAVGRQPMVGFPARPDWSAAPPAPADPYAGVVDLT